MAEAVAGSSVATFATVAAQKKAARKGTGRLNKQSPRTKPHIAMRGGSGAAKRGVPLLRVTEGRGSSWR